MNAKPTDHSITWPYVLRKGHSADPAQGACAMDAVNWLVHGKHGDMPECACPVIGAYVIRGNDAMDDGTRQRLVPYLHRIAGSRSKAHEAARLRIVVLAALRIFAPRALEAAGLTEQAAKLKALPDDVPFTAAADAADAARYAADAAADAARYAAAAARYAAAGVAAAAARYAAAAAADAAARYAADAAADAAARYAAARYAAARYAAARYAAAWDDYFLVLDQVLNAGPQGEPWSADAMEIGTSAFSAAGGIAERMGAV